MDALRHEVPKVHPARNCGHGLSDRRPNAPRQLVEQPAHRDPVAGGAGVGSGEPGGVLADLVEPPLDVVHLEHRRIEAVGRQSALHERAPVALGGREEGGLPVDQQRPVDGDHQVVLAGLAVGDDPVPAFGQLGQRVVGLGPLGDRVEPAPDRRTGPFAVGTGVPRAAHELDQVVGKRWRRDRRPPREPGRRWDGVQATQHVRHDRQVDPLGVAARDPGRRGQRAVAERDGQRPPVEGTGATTKSSGNIRTRRRGVHRLERDSRRACAGREQSSVRK